METFTYLNIVILATFTWYTFDINGHQKAVSSMSVGIVLIMLLFVIAYHVYRFSNIQQLNKLHQSVFCKTLSEKLYTNYKVEEAPEAPADKNTNELLRAIDHNLQEETTHSVLDTLELQDCSHPQHSTSEDARSSTPNPTTNTEVSKCSKALTEMP